jgi:thiamine-phosphate pyrophosphorylase
MFDHRLIVITDRDGPARSLAAHVRRAFDGGTFALLLREKDLPASERERLAAELGAVATEHGGTLIVADPSWPVRAAHLSARAAVPDPRPAVLGRSAHAGEPVDPGLDYATLSPVWATASKPGYGPPLGLAGLRRGAREAAPVPVYALGGVVGPEQAAAAREAGAAGVAVMGAVMRNPDPGAVVAALLDALD